MNKNLFPFEDPDRRCLKVEAWPEADRLAWGAVFQAGDILDGTIGAGCHWSKDTRHKYRRGYGRWLNFLHRSGRFDAASAPAERITPDHVGSYIEALTADGVAPWTLWGRLAELLAVARAIAPDDDWAWLRRVVARFESRVSNAKDKLPRLRAAQEIAAWAYREMDTIRASPPLRDPETRYRDALMVALLITCPTMRLRNLAMIRIGRHLVERSDGYQLVFAAQETKTRQPFAIPVPVSLSPYIRHYLEQVRPGLLADVSDRLWITRQGSPMTEKAVHYQIRRSTTRAFGKPINPHLFRDCAVTTVALEDPTHIGIAAPLLGHRDPRTTEKHYIQANQIVASRRLRGSVDRLRLELAPRRKRCQGEPI